MSDFVLFLQEYNVVGIAVGLVMAAKVNEFVNSLIEDVVTPLLLTPVFKRLNIEKLEDMSHNGILYGKAIAKLISFLVVAILVFFFIKKMWLPTNK